MDSEKEKGESSKIVIGKNENPFVQSMNYIKVQKDFALLCAAWLKANDDAKHLFMNEFGLEEIAQ